MEETLAQVPNDFLETLARTPLSPYESRILLSIARMTWGCGKKIESIALRQLGETTGIDRRNVHRALRNLESRRLVVIGRDDRKAATYRIAAEKKQDFLLGGNSMNSKGRAGRNQREINMGNQWEINGTDRKPAKTKSYRCKRFPFYAIGNRVRFKDGLFETEDIELQRLVESNNWFGVHIEEIAEKR